MPKMGLKILLLQPATFNIVPPNISALFSLVAMVNIHDIFGYLKREVINKDGGGKVQDQNQGVNESLILLSSIFQYDIF
jgi:hypothetical protein